METERQEMTLDEYIDAFKSMGKSANPNSHKPEITSDEYKNFKKMPDSEFREFINKLASGSVQDDKKAKDILAGIGFYEANPRKVERFSPKQMDSILKSNHPNHDFNRQIETAIKTGYVQGVCECVVAVGDDHALGKKLLSEMQVDKYMAKKFANPITFKAMEQGIFAPQQKLEQTHSFKR